MVCAADVPRSRLVKYPLLLKQVVKYSDDTDDIRLLQAAITSLEKVSFSSLCKWSSTAMTLFSLSLFLFLLFGVCRPPSSAWRRLV
jgi:hypothetical protein